MAQCPDQSPLGLVWQCLRGLQKLAPLLFQSGVRSLTQLHQSRPAAGLECLAE